MIVLEEEVQHHKRSFSNLIKKHDCLLKDKLEQDQRLQKEISERLCLKMVSTNTLVLSPAPPRPADPGHSVLTELNCRVVELSVRRKTTRYFLQQLFATYNNLNIVSKQVCFVGDHRLVLPQLNVAKQGTFFFVLLSGLNIYLKAHFCRFTAWLKYIP